MKKIFLTIIIAGFAIGASAQQKWGVINFSTAFLRNAPDYESALETQALMGSVVEVMAEQGIWKLVNMQEPEYMAWTSSMSVVEMTQEEIDAYLNAPKYICTKDYSAIYDKPSTGATRISDLVLGNIVRKALNAKGSPTISVGFYKVLLADGREGYVKIQDVTDFSKWTSSREATKDKLIKTADKFIGTPYMWGGTSVKGMDCSGLIWNVFFLNGIILPRNASGMAACGENVPVYAMEPGDLVFFGNAAAGDVPEKITHVALYLGDAKIIHSSQIVRVNSLSPDGENPYNRQPIRACRILGHTEDGTGAKLLKDSKFY